VKSIIKEFVGKLRFWLSANNNFLFLGFYKYLYSPDENSISGFLNNVSKKHKGDFTVIQIGANDGISHDPIHKFIKRDKWNGVLLEPQKYVYDRYLKRIYKKNKGINCYNAAIGEKDGYTGLFRIGFSNSRWATGLASFNKNHLIMAFESGYIEKCAKKYKIRIPENPHERIIEEKVEVISPDSLIAKFSINKIDLLQIDVEGFDYEVIELFNIKKTRPGIICFESSHIEKKAFSECLSLLAKNNYLTKSMGANTIAMYKPEESYLSFFEN